MFPDSSISKKSTHNAEDPVWIRGWGRFAREGIGYPLQYSWASLVAQLVKNLPAIWETWVQSLGWEDPLKKGNTAHSSILAWRNSMDCIVHGVAKTRTSATFTHVFIESVMPSNYPIFCCHLLLLPSIFPSIRVFSSDLGLHIRWPKYQRISFSISLSKEYSELISSRIDRLSPCCPRTLKSLLQYHSSKQSVLCSALILKIKIHLSHPFMTTGKTIALTI